METNSETIKTISIVSLLGLLMFSVVWIFASGAVVSIPPHSLRSDLFQIGRPIQAIAIDIGPARRPHTAAPVPDPGPVVPEDLVAVVRPVARVVEQLTQPITATQAPSSGDPVESSPKATRDKKGADSQGRGAERSSKAKSKKDPAGPGLSKQGKTAGKKKA